MKRSIVLACGGSGGHIFPAFSVAEELRRRSPEFRLIFICGKKDTNDEIFKIVRSETIYAVDSAQFGGFKTIARPSFLIKLIKGFVDSLKILKREKPEIVVGFGGYSSFPVIMAARMLRIKTLLHEQNVVPGTANKVLGRFADAIALSFDETRKFLRAPAKMTVTGNPIRSAIERDTRDEAFAFFGFNPERTTILVLGGSQGAESINRIFVDAMKLLPPKMHDRIQVLHLCGRMSRLEAASAYESLRISARVFSFFDRMDLAYGVSDFAVGRAGATFLSEIRAKRIPAILIPYPYAGAHQRENALVHSKDSIAIVIDQTEAHPERIATHIKEYVELVEARKLVPVPTDTSPNARVVLTTVILEMIHA